MTVQTYFVFIHYRILSYWAEICPRQFLLCLYNKIKPYFGTFPKKVSLVNGQGLLSRHTPSFTSARKKNTRGQKKEWERCCWHVVNAIINFATEKLSNTLTYSPSQSLTHPLFRTLTNSLPLSLSHSHIWRLNMPPSIDFFPLSTMSTAGTFK